jgi:hypothetical protein
MLSAIQIVQWVYSEADPAHIEKFLLCNESGLAVIVASSCADVRFCHDAVNAFVSLEGGGSQPESPQIRLAKDGVLFRLTAEALAAQARSVLCHAHPADGTEWLIVGCRSTFDGFASVILVAGRVQPHAG